MASVGIKRASDSSSHNGEKRAKASNGLDSLREMTVVVADTGDLDSIRTLQPTDATTNPSLLLQAVQDPKSKAIVAKAIEQARATRLTGNALVEEVCDQLNVLVGCEILRNVPGLVSTEVDADLSFDTTASVAKARKLSAMYEKAGFGRDRVLIKLGSTWESIQACRILEKEGIHCNMTLLFAFCQAVACAEAGASLISPFVGRILDWYKKAEGKEFSAEEDPGVLSVRQIYNYYKKFGYKTTVMGASFRSLDEILALAGCDKLTIAPKFLEALKKQTDPVVRRLDPFEAKDADRPAQTIDEATFRKMLNADAMATEKLAEGIRGFAKDTEKLKAIVRSNLEPANALEALRQMTVVVADTGDLASIVKYAPEDATTNPSLLLQAMQSPDQAPLIDRAIECARGAGASGEALVQETCDQLAVLIGCEILRNVPGLVSTEVDADLSFDTQATIAKARKLSDLYEKHGYGRDRVLIKLGSTWECIEACRVLEKEGIHCNMTLLFSFSQAVACAEAGATLISPFVGRILDWYKKAEGREFNAEEDPGVLSVRKIYNYYKKFGYQTTVMGASFRSIEEILALAGCDKLTIAPKFLEALEKHTDPVTRQLDIAKVTDVEKIGPLNEATFRHMLNADAMATEKLAEGLRGFDKDLGKLKDLVRARLESK